MFKAILLWSLLIAADPPTQPAPVVPSNPTGDIVLPDLTPPAPKPPAPPKPPPPAIVSLGADTLYVVVSNSPFLAASFPAERVTIAHVAGPITIRGKFVEDPNVVQTRTFTQKYVATIEAASTGTCELAILPAGATDEKQIIRRPLDVAIQPIPPPVPPGPFPPEPPLPPAPPAPAATGTYAVVVIDKTKASAATAAAIDGPTLRALKAKNQCRIYDVTEHAADLAARGYAKLMADDKLSPDCIFIMDENGHRVIGVKLPTDESKLAALVKGSMKP